MVSKHTKNLATAAIYSVNPVDIILRLGVAPEGGDWWVFGFDAAGVVETLRAVHARIESGSARGKIVLEGF